MEAKIILAKAIKDNWYDTGIWYEREEEQYCCIFCDSSCSISVWQGDNEFKKLREEALKTIEHELDCAYLLAMKILKRHIKNEETS